MENSWQVKCGSSTTTTPSTSIEARNQVEINSGHYFHPHVVHDLRPVQGRVQDLVTPNIQNTYSRVAHGESGTSFLALLSGQPSLLQCDVQEPTNSKGLRASSKWAINGIDLTIGAVGNGMSPVAGAPTPDLQSNKKMHYGATISCGVSTRSTGTSNVNNNSAVYGGVQANNSSLFVDLTNSGTHQLVPDNEKAKYSSSMKDLWHKQSSANAEKFCTSTIRMSERVPLDAKFSSSNQSSICTSGCPRVICLGASGDLVLSNTGLLGIVCSCHHSHLSVAKFVEHLGLFDVNPGDAVRMDSGETIARWRKLYFQKFGIRIPDDQSGWDWNEAFSVAAGLVKSSMGMSNMAVNSDMVKQVGSTGGSMQSGQPLDKIVNLNARTDQSFVADALHEKEQRHSQDNSNYILKGFIDSLQSNIGSSRCSTMSKFINNGTNSSSQFESGHVFGPTQFRNLNVSHPNPQNFRTVAKLENSCGRDVADRSAAPSNVELRLGQPYEQSQYIGSSVPLAIGPKLFEMLNDSSKPYFPQQMYHNASIGTEMGEFRQHFQCSTALPNLLARKEQCHLAPRSRVCGVSNAVDANVPEKFEGYVARSSVIPLLSHVSSLPERTANKDGHSVVTSGHVMMNHLNCEQPHPDGNSHSGSERQPNITDLCFLRFADKGKGKEHPANSSYASPGSDFKIQTQPGKHATSVAVATNCDPCFLAVHENNYYSHRPSVVAPDAFSSRNHFFHVEKLQHAESSRQIDRAGAVPRSIHIPTKSEKNLQSQVVSMAYPSAISTTSLHSIIIGTSKTQGNCVGSYLSDDDMRLVALKQIELSRPQLAQNSLELDKGKGRMCGISNVNIQHPFSANPLSIGGLRHGPNLAAQPNLSDLAAVSSPSGCFTRLGVNDEKSAPMPGLNNVCDLSFSAPRNPVSSKGNDMQFPYPCAPLPNKQLPFRSENVTQSSESANCCHGVPCRYFPGHCNFDNFPKCFGYPMLRVGSCSKSFNEEVSALVSSNFVKDQDETQGKVSSMERRGDLKGQLPKNIALHNSQWRDVPSKFNTVSEVICLDHSPGMLDHRKRIESQAGDVAANACCDTIKIPDPSKEQEISNVSSGCSSAAVVTQASGQINMDSTVNTGSTSQYVNNLVVDEGSGIDKCWSSDDALESERSSEFLGADKIELCKEGSSKVVNNQSSRSLLDELKLIDSMTWKKGRKLIQDGPIFHGKMNLRKSERGFEIRIREKGRKLRKLEATSSKEEVHFECAAGTSSFDPCSSKDEEDPSDDETSTSGTLSIRTASKRRKSMSSSSKELSRKRDLHMIYNGRDGDGDCQIEPDRNTCLCKAHELSVLNKCKRACTSDCIGKSQMEELVHLNAENIVSCKLAKSPKPSSSHELNISCRRGRPVVCGKLGEICSGKPDADVRPAKIVPLSKVLKAAKRCRRPKNCKPKQTVLHEPMEFSYSEAELVRFSNSRKEVFGTHHASFCGEMDAGSTANKLKADQLANLEKDFDQENRKGYGVLDSNVELKPKKRSLFELTTKGKQSYSRSSPLIKISKCSLKMKQPKASKNGMGDKPKDHGLSSVNIERSNQEHRSLSAMDSESFCCVCGGSNTDELNCLLECNRCFIKVHQACYGVSKVPKGHWYCRPCKTGSEDIVCVLCGYGGGAMTRALRSRMIVKTLLKAWNIESKCQSRNAVCTAFITERGLNVLHSSGSIHEGKHPALGPFVRELSTATVCAVDSHKQVNIGQNSLCCVNDSRVHNSITAGELNSTVKQWVHMVCGLWTPGTRCPNVNTMSAFDVSGAPRLIGNAVCSVCHRPGGSCIQCRVVNCHVLFHPWCAHQKGLLQSEIEGDENESVGFYGRCQVHATHPLCDSGNGRDDSKVDFSGEQEWTCARTEGYRGRKRDGVYYNIYGKSNGKGACIVPQEQLNAWIYINGEKSHTQTLHKLPASEVESDCRKEYARYKQSKGWKHLVVYKSGIHALGLYTSRFISRGEMVVEYVGEIVGQRVVDKRENEYQSGRKLQYESACYFFRIDKEHVIDATCKGGIARFVNHSCLPNCVAKVITIRNEKKVVFFAERDIYPGEEITYDYHFNHEDEGKKIPCFCNSKNCRRYLN